MADIFSIKHPVLRSNKTIPTYSPRATGKRKEENKMILRTTIWRGQWSPKLRWYSATQTPATPLLLCPLFPVWTLNLCSSVHTQQFINFLFFRVSRPAFVGSTFCSPGVEVVVGPWTRDHVESKLQIGHIRLYVFTDNPAQPGDASYSVSGHTSYTQGRKWLVLFEVAFASYYLSF